MVIAPFLHCRTEAGFFWLKDASWLALMVIEPNTDEAAEPVSQLIIDYFRTSFRHYWWLSLLTPRSTFSFSMPSLSPYLAGCCIGWIAAIAATPPAASHFITLLLRATPFRLSSHATAGHCWFSGQAFRRLIADSFRVSSSFSAFLRC